MKSLSLLVLACAACSGSAPHQPTVGPRAFSAGDTCPMPTTPNVTARFVVGTTPTHSVPSMMSDHGITCTDDLTPNEVLSAANGTLTLVTEGTFQGSCKESPGPRTYEAVKAGKLAIAVTSTHVGTGGPLGPDQPVLLSMQAPDKLSGVTVDVLDRCGGALEIGAPAQPVAWTPGPGCDAVAKLVPYEHEGIHLDNQVQFAPVGPGSCTFTAEWFGATGTVQITVK